MNSSCLWLFFKIFILKNDETLLSPISAFHVPPVYFKFFFLFMKPQNLDSKPQTTWGCEAKVSKTWQGHDTRMLILHVLPSENGSVSLQLPRDK